MLYPLAFRTFKLIRHSNILLLKLEMVSSSASYEATPQFEGEKIAPKIKLSKEVSSQKIATKDILMVVIPLVAIFVGWIFFEQTRPSLNKETPLTQKDHILQALQKMEDSPAYLDIESDDPLGKLPFCVVMVGENSEEELQIKESLSRQGYHNYQTIMPLSGVNNYNLLQNAVQMKCPEGSILLFANKPLKQDGLAELNRYYQKYNTWMIYDHNKETNEVEVLSLYRRIFSLVKNNAFSFSNKALLDNNDENAIVTAILELCRFHNKKMQASQIFDSKETVFSSIMKTNSNQEKSSVRTPYQPLYNLNQDYELKEWQNEIQLKKYRALQSSQNNENDLHSKNQKIKSYEYLSLIYLPESHSLNVREEKQAEQRYRLSEIKEETPFCVTVLSRNNIENHRYKKAMQSILQQDYSNYHIVFIDDASNDQTLAQTKQYLEERNFPKDRVTYVKNLHNNFATYNIINAAFQYCRADEVQVLVDGDDELVGKKAFKTMNSAYVSDENTWVAFSGYVNMLFQNGRSYPFEDEHDLSTIHEKRRFGHFISPIRTWKVSLVRAIPKEHHEDFSGSWLETLYDDGIMYPLNELAGTERIKYINELNYFYNNLYTGGDGDTFLKRFSRFWFKIEILLRKPLEKLGSLEEDHTQYDILQTLKLDKGVKYLQVE